MRWLITGGAGYIGSHVVLGLREAGHEAVVVDDLSTGHRSFVPADVALHEVSILDRDRLVELLRGERCDGVVHLAARKYAGVSVREPLAYYETNVTGTHRLVAAMLDAGVHRLLYSSSAAAYGTPTVDLVEEDTATDPESPYGESKLVGEWLIRDVERASPLRATSLRYFNVVGSGSPHLYDTSPHNLFPIVLKALTEGRTPMVNGTDYATRDGSCERDYLHVADLARAHVLAAERLGADQPLAPVYNVGTGTGLTVLEVLDALRRATGIDFEVTAGPRRPGDPARIVASGRLVRDDLGWVPQHGIADMAASAWAAWQAAVAAQDPAAV